MRLVSHNLYIYSMNNIGTHKVRMYNDDHNSFLYIMACLIKYCSHEPIQAEQCAVIAEKKGYCDIKYGDFMAHLPISCASKAHCSACVGWCSQNLIRQAITYVNVLFLSLCRISLCVFKFSIY